MRRRDGGIGCGARGRGMNAPPKLPGGAGVPPGGTTTPREELADTGISPPGESAARRRKDAAMERRTARTRRHGCPRRKAWRLKDAPLGAPSHRIAEGGKKRDYGVPGAAKNTGDGACLGGYLSKPGARLALAATHKSAIGL